MFEETLKILKQDHYFFDPMLAALRTAWKNIAATDPGEPEGLGGLEGLGRSGFVVQEVHELQEVDKIWISSQGYTLPIEKIITLKNARAWVSMVFT